MVGLGKQVNVNLGSIDSAKVTEDKGNSWKSNSIFLKIIRDFDTFS